jgi:hypothetical protein
MGRARAATAALVAASVTVLLSACTTVVGPHAQSPTTVPSTQQPTTELSTTTLETIPPKTVPRSLATVSGSITVNGVVHEMHFGYARTIPAIFDEGASDVEVVLSDVPLNELAQTDPKERQRLVDTGSLHGIVMLTDPTRVPISTQLLDDGFVGPSPSGLDSSDVFKAELTDSQTIRATYTSSDTHEGFAGDQFAFDVSFDLFIIRAAYR